MNKKRWFTLAEIMLTISIMSVLIFVMRPFFQSKKKDYIYIESCINKIYGDMNNFMYNSATSKWIASWSNDRIFPDKYTIQVKNSWEIILWYTKDDGNTGTYRRDYLKGLAYYYCVSKEYTSKFSWDFFTLSINKISWGSDANSQWYELTGSSSQFTGATSLYLCYTGDLCREVANFEVDTRIQTIKKKKCLILNENYWPCIERDQ